MVRKFHIDLIKELQVFNGYFYKEDFLDWLLDLDDLFDFENIYYERKVGLVLNKLSEYALRWWERVQSDRNLFMAKDEKDACYQILSFGL